MKVLITGAASGIGNSCLNYFLSNGHEVYAIDLIALTNKERLTSFSCDITSEKDLLDIKDYFNANSITFDLIINIAGIHKMASLIETDYSKIKKVIDINLLGPILVNNTFHSFLKEKGKIIIVTSEVAGYDPLPFNGIYSISKVALESYAQSLRQELNLLNQKVITIQPGAIQTPLSNYSLKDTENLANSTILFKKQSSKFLNIVKKFMGKPIHPNKVGKLIFKVSKKKHPKLTYRIHRSPGLILLNILPKKLQCSIIKMILN